MSKLGDIKKSICNMLKKDPQEKIDKGSNIEENDVTGKLNDGSHDKIYGFNKKIIKGTVVGIVVVFISAFWVASDDSDAQKHSSETQQRSKNQEAVDPQVAANSMGYANDYKSLQQQEARKIGKNDKAQTTQRTTVSNSGGSKVTTEEGAAPVPQISTRNLSQYQPAYSTPYPVPQSIQQPQNLEQDQTKEVKNKFGAAIAFALGLNKETESNPSEEATPSSASPTLSSPKTTTYTALAEHMIQAGTVIPAILVTGINTDVGGKAVAQIMQHTYDSFGNLLIPAGSRIIGTYSAGASNGQNRVSIAWSLLVLPDNSSYTLSTDTMVTTDSDGYAGIIGHVNNHTVKMLGSGTFTSALAALASVASGNTNSNNDSNNYSAGQLAAQGATSNLLNTASSLFQKNMNIQPTITVKAGYEFNIFVSQAVYFKREL